MTSKYVVLIVFIAFILIGVSSADSVIYDATGSGNLFPFGNGGYVGEYQQAYASSEFSGPVKITAITFFPWSRALSSTITGNFTITLSTTTASLASLSTTYANNIGGDVQTFFSGGVSGVLTFNGDPFFFDPANGNLLLDVVVNMGDPQRDILEAGSLSTTARVINLFGTGAPTLDGGQGLKTEFTFTPAGQVPKPSTLMLLGSGLAGFAGVIRRKLFR